MLTLGRWRLYTTTCLIFYEKYRNKMTCSSTRAALKEKKKTNSREMYRNTETRNRNRNARAVAPIFFPRTTERHMSKIYQDAR